LNGGAGMAVIVPSPTPGSSPSVLSPMNIMTPGASGSLALSLQSTPASGTTVDKGQKAEVARYKVQSASSDMSVSNITLDFNSRLWLYASSITVKDENGNIVAEDTSLTSNDFTEMVAGSNYRLSLQARYIVSKTSVKYFTVSVSAHANSDRAQGSISITRFEVRSKDGANVADTQTESSVRSFTYLAGTSGAVVLTANAYTPPNMRVTISTSAPADNVVLGVADFKSVGKTGKLTKLTLYMNTSNDTAANTGVRALFGDVKVKVGDKVYSADSVGSVVTFSNMNSILPADTLVPVAIMVKVNTNNTLDGISASSTLVGSGTTGGSSNNPVVEDSSMVTMDIQDAALLTSDITFASGISTMDAPTASLTGPITNNTSTSVSYGMKVGFTIYAGDSSLYVSKNPSVALATTSSGFADATSAGLVDVTAGPDSLAGDTSTYYVIPAGSSRRFTYNGSANGTYGSGLKTFAITGVNYGSSVSALAANTVIFYNYGQLKVAPTF
jgi:hypothetical protein